MPISIVSVCAAMAATAGAGVTIDASAAPEHREWAEKAAPIAEAWLPRLANLLAVPGARTPGDIRVTITPDYKGVAYASGDRITMAAAWVRDHPEDAVGALIHELVHVIQGYPGGSEHWLTEGIADFVRFSIYEGKPASYFPKPGKPHGYRDAYQVAAGFLAWLEAGPAPGIVRRLHAALRAQKYDAQLFETVAGKTVDDLWRDYTAEAGTARLPAALTKLSFGDGRGTFTPMPGGEWLETQNGREHARFREVSRTADAIELHDAGRGIRLRLTGEAVLLQRGSQFTPLYPASWEAEPSVKP